jgi:hypothetical protein
MSSSSREKVLELVNMGVTQPRKILKELEKANLPMLTKIQISNLKSRENIKANGKATCYLNEWLLWIKQGKLKFYITISSYQKKKLNKKFLRNYFSKIKM